MKTLFYLVASLFLLGCEKERIVYVCCEHIVAESGRTYTPADFGGDSVISSCIHTPKVGWTKVGPGIYPPDTSHVIWNGKENIYMDAGPYTPNHRDSIEWGLWLTESFKDETPIKPLIVNEVRKTGDFGTWELTTEDSRGIEFVMYVNEKDKNYKRYHKGDTIQ